MILEARGPTTPDKMDAAFEGLDVSGRLNGNDNLYFVTPNFGEEYDYQEPLETGGCDNYLINDKSLDGIEFDSNYEVSFGNLSDAGSPQPANTDPNELYESADPLPEDSKMPNVPNEEQIAVTETISAIPEPIVESYIHFPTDASDDLCEVQPNQVACTQGLPADRELKPSIEELREILGGTATKQCGTTIEICHDDESNGIVVDAVEVIERNEEELQTTNFPESGFVSHDVISGEELKPPLKTPQTPVSDTRPKINKGGRPIVEPRDPSLSSSANSRNRKKQEMAKILMHVEKLEGAYCRLYGKANFDQLYKSNGFTDEVDGTKQKIGTRHKRPKASRDEERNQRKKEQNKIECKKSREKKKRLVQNAKIKRDLLLTSLPFDVILSLGIAQLKVEIQ